MKRIIVGVAVLLVAGAGLALNEFGNLVQAQGEHPEFFKPGSVTETTLDGAVWYVYCGDAEKCFSEEKSEELYQEAEIQAKMNLYEFFVRKNKDCKVDVSVTKVRKLYQFADGKEFYVVMGVPKANVVVTVTPMAPAAVVDQPVVPVVKAVSTVQPPVVMSPVSFANPAPVCSVTQQPKQPSVAEGDASAEQTIPASDGLTDDQKLMVLRARLDARPEDFRVRMRMARIFSCQGNSRRALRNYADAARLIALDEYTVAADKAVDLKEIAQFEEVNGAGAMALKHYRVLQRLGGPDDAAFATRRISALLLRYE